MRTSQRPVHFGPHLGKLAPVDTVVRSSPSSTAAALDTLRSALNARIIDQEPLVERMLVALLCDGHLLVEGAPGLAKTTAVKTLAELIEGDYHRVQFTPDLLPADITGTDIYRPQDGRFEFQPGPVFHNLLLADEINRAPAKVQSALLEAMAERQVTVGRTTHELPELFLVMATQNPIEQEGTFPLPEAQLDRFLLHVRIGYPSADSEQKILELNRRPATPACAEQIAEQVIFTARREAAETYLAPALERYLVELVVASREPQRYGDDLAGNIAYGASPRATLALDRVTRARAWLRGRDHVTPEDVHQLAHDVLRHRILLSFHAQAQGLDSDQIVDTLLDRVPVP